MPKIIAALAVMLALSSLSPALAQPPNAPTDCTEAKFGATAFVGHDCGEWASVVIAGNIIIRKPWSWANEASRPARIRADREESAEVVTSPVDDQGRPGNKRRAATSTPAATETPTVRNGREAREINPIGSPTARCEDGSLSYSASRSGTCSHHGGVAVWY